MKLSILEKLITIYERSGMSVSRFANIIGKDRRTLTSWINKSVTKDPPKEVLDSVARFFRYPERIWDTQCDKDEFFTLLTYVPKSEIAIIDRGYEGGLEYILEKEYERRFVIHPRFPGPAYRDKIIAFPYKFGNSQRAKNLRQERCNRILDASFESVEWYSIESLLHFAFSPIGNFYTQTQKKDVLALMIETFEDNYNKSLYLFDAQNNDVLGIDTTYASINPINNLMFFKMPIESLILEVCNKQLVSRIHKHFTTPSNAPKHIATKESLAILRSLQKCLKNNQTLYDFYHYIRTNTALAPFFACAISAEYRTQTSFNY